MNVAFQGPPDKQKAECRYPMVRRIDPRAQDRLPAKPIRYLGPPPKEDMMTRRKQLGLLDQNIVEDLDGGGGGIDEIAPTNTVLTGGNGGYLGPPVQATPAGSVDYPAGYLDYPAGYFDPPTHAGGNVIYPRGVRDFDPSELGPPQEISPLPPSPPTISPNNGAEVDGPIGGNTGFGGGAIVRQGGKGRVGPPKIIEPAGNDSAGSLLENIPTAYIIGGGALVVLGLWYASSK